MIQEDKDLFLAGRSCEIHGLGIGAVSYYRRVVEHQRDRILAKLIEVSKKLDAAPEVIQDLEAAMAEQRFEASLDRIKHALPTALMIGAENPLKLLHGYLSDGLHDRGESECLEAARTARLVLIELADRMGRLMKSNQELEGAIAVMADRRRTKKQGASAEEKK